MDNNYCRELSIGENYLKLVQKFSIVAFKIMNEIFRIYIRWASGFLISFDVVALT